MRPRINWRFLIPAVLLLVGAAVALHFTHRRQVRSQSGAYLRQADEARTAGDDAREVRFLERYLTAHPEATDERERLVRLLAKNAATGRDVQNVLLMIDDVLRRDPARTEFRRFAVAFTLDPRMGGGLVREAKGYLAELLKAVPDDGDLEAKYALCLKSEGEFKSAADWYQKAYTHKPDLLDAYAGRALLLQEQLGDPDEADRVMAEMVERNRGAARAHLLHADYWTRYRQSGRAAAALAAARALAPDDLQVILTAAEATRTAARDARLKGDAKEADAKEAEARAELDRGVKLHPKSPLVYHARAALDENDPSAAVAVLTGGLEVVPNDPLLLHALLECQHRLGNADAVAATLDRLEKVGSPANRLTYAYERARLVMLRGDWPAAARALERVREDARGDAAMARRVSLLLGRCYARTGENESRLDAVTRAVPDDPTDPNWVPSVSERADALAALGRADEALQAYQALADSGQAAGAWLPVARLRVLRTLRTEPEHRDWGLAEEAVERAVKERPGDTEPLLLRTDLLALRGRGADARPLIDDLFAKRPKEPAVWVAKAAQQLRDGSRADALAVLEKGRVELADPVELRIAQARFTADPKDSESAKRLSALADGADKYPADARHELFRAVAVSAAAVGDAALADRMWDKVVAARPNDLSAHLVRFDRRMAAGDEAGLERVQAEIRKADGEAGKFTRAARAFALIWKAQKKGDRSGLAEATALLDGLEQDRAAWPRVPFGRAVILDLEGKPDAALPYYQQAFDRGERDPQALKRLTALLAAKGKFGEANDVLAKVSDAATDPDALRLAAAASLKSDDPKRALELASKAVPEDSKSGADQQWLARVKWAAGDQAGAEKPFRRAADLNPEDPDGWLMLVEYLVATRRPDDAQAVIEQAKGKVRSDAVPLLLARSSALLGRFDEARAAFEKARAARPNDPAVLQAEADFLTAAQRWTDARAAWERVMNRPGASADDKQVAVRMLAVCLAVDPDYATARRALDVLGPEAEGEPPARRRTRAVVLALQKDRANKLAAIKLLEADRDALAPSDRFLLAQLYHQVGDRANVRVTMTELLRTADRTPLYLAFFAGWLLDQPNPRDAEPWVAKLETVQPDALRTAELRVRVLMAKGDPAGARAVLKGLEGRPTPPFGFLAAVCEMVGLDAEAEEYLKKVVGGKQTPEAAFALAGFYARRGRMAEALAECEAGWKTCPPVTAGQGCVEVLAAAPTPDPEATKRVAGWIDEARGKHPTAAPALLLQLAYVRNLEGRYDAAIDIYRGLTVGDRPDPLALNNLAYLISVKLNRHDDALALLERARQVVGPIPDLLDTEALVRTARGTKDDLATARRLLQDVVALAPCGAAYFHLAVLEQKAENKADAQTAWQEARQRKLKQADLHPLEWPAFREMEGRWK